MKTNWQTKKLSDICDKASSNISQNQLKNEEGEYPIYGASGFIKNISFYHQDKDYISIIKDGAGIGRIALLPAKSSVIGTLQYLLPKQNIDIRFLYYILNGFDFSKYKNGSTIPHIYFREYSEEKFLVPPLPEQKRIVKKLDEVFEKVATAKENAEKNLQNSKELFEVYLQNVFKNHGKDWDEQGLVSLCEVEYGYTEKAKISGKYRFVRITDTDEDGLLTQENKMYVGSFKDAGQYILNNGDLLMARTGASAGNVLFYEGNEEAVFASYLIRLKFKKEISSKLYWFFSKSKLYWNQVRQLSAGSAQPQFNGGALKKIVFPFPKSLTEQKAIIKKLGALSGETKKLEKIYEQKLADFEELKKSVLRQAFTGKL